VRRERGREGYAQQDLAVEDFGGKDVGGTQGGGMKSDFSQIVYFHNRSITSKDPNVMFGKEQEVRYPSVSSSRFYDCVVW
jgi:hypothetical protein